MHCNEYVFMADNSLVHWHFVWIHGALFGFAFYYRLVICGLQRRLRRAHCISTWKWHCRVVQTVSAVSCRWTCCYSILPFQCFDTDGQVTGRASGL